MVTGTAVDTHLRAVIALIESANRPGRRPILFTFRYAAPGVVDDIEIAGPVPGSGQYID